MVSRLTWTELALGTFCPLFAHTRCSVRKSKWRHRAAALKDRACYDELVALLKLE